MRKLPRVLILWGVPGVGKSTYARWLRDDKDFTYIDTDSHGAGSGRIARAWRALLDGHSTPEQFMEVARYSPSPVVVEFGMYANPSGIAALDRFRKAGAEAWWFDGNRDAALVAWRAENVKGSRYFPTGDAKWHEVVGVINANAEQIHEFFGAHIVRTIEAGPVHIEPDVTFSQMFGEA